MPTETLKSQGQPAIAGCPFFYSDKLTERERAVLTLAAMGRTGREIALQLSIAEITVKKHREAACQALGAVNTTQAVAIAVARGLIELDTFSRPN